MNKVILDTSAFLAMIHNEPGASIVDPHMAHAVMSSVNISEAAAVLEYKGMPRTAIPQLFITLAIENVAFSLEQAYLAATLKNSTKHLGLSLGDRACLSLAQLINLPVLTGDKIWGKLAIGLDIKLIR